MTLTVDFLPSILDVCGIGPIPKTHGRSWKPLAMGQAAPGWRTRFAYFYNYEQQFPFTPNVRAVRTAEWKYIHYPHGDGGPDRHKADLFHLSADPAEAQNLIDDPRYAGKVAELRAELDRLLQATGAVPDKMPLDEGIKQQLPDASIR